MNHLSQTKIFLLQAKENPKMTLKMVLEEKIIILNENSCHLVNLLSL